jgi:hypothetical protein
MPASVTSRQEVQSTPWSVVELKLTGLVADLQENLSFAGYGPSGAPIHAADFEVVTIPTDHSPVFMEHAAASDSLTANTAAIRFYTVAGGSLDGAVVKLRLHFNASASGGIGA